MSEPPRQDSPGEAPPRFSGIRTFARQQHTRELDGADVAVVGVPFDEGTSFRPGPRFGPEAIRSASVLVRNWHPVHDVEVFERLRVVDWGDVELSPGNAERAVGQIAEQLAPVVESGAVPLTLGGDHTIALGELRALAARHGPLGLVLLDSHADTWDSYRGERYFHGTPFRRAVEEGLLDPARSLLAGMRGSLYSSRDLAEAREMGFELVLWQELRAMHPDAYGRLARDITAGGPAFFSFDVDFVDPAFAPATGTPEVGGPTSAEVFDFVRALAGTRFAGFDVVEVSPPYDGPGQVTALLAANVAYEMLALRALAS
ncbi:MAG: agmatinase [Actinomycetota bacterium]